LNSISVSGINVRFREKGSGRPLLLIHGLGGSIESWTHNIDPLSETARVIALDLPGFGQSDKPLVDYTIPFYRDFVIGFMRQVGLEKTSVVGSSMGGQIGAEVAIAKPGVIDRLVLVSPSGALPRSFRATGALKRYIRVTSAKSVAEVKKALFAVDKKPVDDAYAEQVFARFSEPNAAQAFHSALRHSAAAARLTSRLKKIRSSTLLLWGKEDIMIPVKYVEPFIRMENCRVVLLEHAGHRPHAERPGVFNSIVREFIGEN
jgi:pimeloyl-ACP methyl ester carboxylesterase